MNAQEPDYWFKEDIASLLRCSHSKAYKLMQAWNKELAAMGYMVQRGCVPRKYAIDRLGLEARAVGQEENHRGTKDSSRRSAGVFRGRDYVGLSVRSRTASHV